MASEKLNLLQTVDRMVVTRAKVLEEWGDIGKKVQTSSQKISYMDLLYSKDLIYCIIYFKFAVTTDLTIHTKTSLIIGVTEVCTNLIVVIISQCHLYQVITFIP